jgi:hypothetical protein
VPTIRGRLVQNFPSSSALDDRVRLACTCSMLLLACAYPYPPISLAPAPLYQPSPTFE